jgi:hypothetical protein
VYHHKRGPSGGVDLRRVAFTWKPFALLFILALIVLIVAVKLIIEF